MRTYNLYVHMSTFQLFSGRKYEGLKKSCGSNIFHIQGSCLGTYFQKIVPIKCFPTWFIYVPMLVHYGTTQRQHCTRSSQITTCMLDILCSMHFSRALLFIIHRMVTVEAWNNLRVLANITIKCHSM